MASTKQTPHLGLSQWVLTDPFRMDDFNRDNAKIDAAIERLQALIDAIPYVKLMEVTTSVDAAQVDLDVSGIDFSKYAMVQLVSNAVTRNSSGRGTIQHGIKIKINGLGGYFCSQRQAGGTYCDYAAGVSHGLLRRDRHPRRSAKRRRKARIECRRRPRE